MITVFMLILFDVLSKKIIYSYPFRIAYLGIDVILLGCFKTRLIKNIDLVLLVGLCLTITLSRVNDVVNFNRVPMDNDFMDIPSYIVVHAAVSLPHYRQWYYCLIIPLVFFITFPISRVFFHFPSTYNYASSAVIFLQFILVSYGGATAHYIKFELMVRSYIADHSLVESSKLDIMNGEERDVPLETIYDSTVAVTTSKDTSDNSLKREYKSQNRPKRTDKVKQSFSSVKQKSKQALMTKFNDPEWESKCKYIDFRDTLRVLRRSLPLNIFSVAIGCLIQYSVGSQKLGNVLLILGMQSGAFLLFAIVVYCVIYKLKIVFPKKTEKDNISVMPIDSHIYKKNNLLESLIFLVSMTAVNCFMIGFNTFNNQQEVFTTYIDAVTTLRMRRSTLLVFTLIVLVEGVVFYALYKSSSPDLSDAYLEIVKAIAFGAVEGLVLGYYLVYLRRKLFEKNAKRDALQSQNSSKVSEV